MTVPAVPFYGSQVMTEWGFGAGHYGSELAGLPNVPAAPYYGSAFAGLSNLVIGISPTDANDNGSTSLHSFVAFTASSNLTVSSYTWGFDNAINGTFSLISGAGTAIARPRVTGVPGGETAQADFYCDMVIGGVTHRVSAPLSYARS